ncbi:MAG: bifunctional DNA-formamidopyrimidine glycosylase/DNA-(apurinic or apyrimidinic site) lyase, partial [Actinomycetota bacterium]
EIECVSRRGKFLWLPLGESDESLNIHLGMSGQALLVVPDAPDERHLRVRLELDRDDIELRYVDQRMFGGLHLDELVTIDRGQRLPTSVTHIARDVLDPDLDEPAVIADIRRRASGIKSVLLNQQIISGIGNIYADEALWLSKLNYLMPAGRLSRAQVAGLLSNVRAVMESALKAGGTSFDDLYVGVNGESGWFDLSLNAYGQEGLPCPRCGRPIVRESWANRSSHRCPRCQPKPRA